MVPLQKKKSSTWWINYFNDLCERNLFNPSNDLENERLWFCFSDVIQDDLDYVKEQWNTHRIRDSKQDTIPGIPNDLYNFPEKNGGIENLGIIISAEQITFVQENLLQFDEDENIMNA